MNPSSKHPADDTETKKRPTKRSHPRFRWQQGRFGRQARTASPSILLRLGGSDGAILLVTIAREDAQNREQTSRTNDVPSAVQLCPLRGYHMRRCGETLT